MKTKIILMSASVLILCSNVYGQYSPDTSSEVTSKIDFKITADIVSSYIWRGTVASHDPNIQPTIALVSGGFEAGVWGSTNFLGSYKEVDPYIAYTWKFLKVSLYDYNWTFKNRYFDYRNASTDHILEGSLTFLGTEKFPLSVSLNTMFYGADKKFDKDSEAFLQRQNYSTYLELGWLFGKSTVFLGMTPANGYYGAGYGRVDGFAVCNLGFSTQRNIRITPEYEIPLKGTLFINPQEESIHFVIGITL